MGHWTMAVESQVTEKKHKWPVNVKTLTFPTNEEGRNQKEVLLLISFNKIFIKINSFQGWQWNRETYSHPLSCNNFGK